MGRSSETQPGESAGGTSTDGLGPSVRRASGVRDDVVPGPGLSSAGFRSSTGSAGGETVLPTRLAARRAGVGSDVANRLVIDRAGRTVRWLAPWLTRWLARGWLISATVRIPR